MSNPKPLFQTPAGQGLMRAWLNGKKPTAPQQAAADEAGKRLAKAHAAKMRKK